MAPDKSWVRIYDHSDFNLLFYPLDVAELPDGGFLILSSGKPDSVKWPTPYILCTDKEGQSKWKVDVGSPYESPVPNIIRIGDENYFFCKDESHKTYVLKIDPNGSMPTLFKTLDNLTFPLYATQTSDNKILLSSYNRINRTTVLTCFNESFSVLWSQEYSCIDDFEEKVRGHLTKQGTNFPFFIGEINSNAGNYYFVNGFYIYIFSLIFVNPSNGSYTGVVNGIPYSAAASSLAQLNDSSYLLTRYDENQNYINTHANITFTETSDVTKMGGTSWPEISKNASVKPLKITLNNKDYVVLSTITRSNQILLLFFDSETGLLKNSKYFGSTYPVNLASVIPTSEGGMAVLTQTYVAGRFPRIQLIKIPPEDLKF